MTNKSCLTPRNLRKTLFISASVIICITSLIFAGCKKPEAVLYTSWHDIPVYLDESAKTTHWDNNIKELLDAWCDSSDRKPQERDNFTAAVKEIILKDGTDAAMNGTTLNIGCEISLFGLNAFLKQFEVP